MTLLESLTAALPLIAKILEEEGASVELAGDNPDFVAGAPNSVVRVTNDSTQWTAKVFRGDSISACLEQAIAYGGKQ